MSPEELVTAFCAEWKMGSAETIASYFSKMLSTIIFRWPRSSGAPRS